MFVANRRGNLYKMDIDELSDQMVSCLMSEKEDHWLWHKKCSHASLRLIFKVEKHNLVRGLPIMSFKDNLLSQLCVKGKQVKNYFKCKNDISTQKHIELIHLVFFGPTRTKFIRGKRYGIVVYDFTGWTPIRFLHHTDKSYKVLCKNFKQIQIEKSLSIISISDHGVNLKMKTFKSFAKTMD